MAPHSSTFMRKELKQALKPARIPLQLIRPVQFSSYCKTTSQSSPRPRIESKESSNLNPLDYRLWSELERMVCYRAHPNLGSLNLCSRFPVLSKSPNWRNDHEEVMRDLEIQVRIQSTFGSQRTNAASILSENTSHDE
ncbi:unnamed protein product [Nezara viridula]|uniref:Uncharacterized protein n=1 Tax=Nezara viridula TaxID=85310 RepID=A0A9P0HJV2_NEZVI|nr:unnamed protein product [Nezara viridula]